MVFPFAKQFFVVFGEMGKAFLVFILLLTLIDEVHQVWKLGFWLHKRSWLTHELETSTPKLSGPKLQVLFYQLMWITTVDDSNSITRGTGQ